MGGHGWIRRKKETDSWKSRMIKKIIIIKKEVERYCWDII